MIVLTPSLNAPEAMRATVKTSSGIRAFFDQTVAENNARLDAMPPSPVDLLEEIKKIEALLLVLNELRQQ